MNKLDIRSGNQKILDELIENTIHQIQLYTDANNLKQQSFVIRRTSCLKCISIICEKYNKKNDVSILDIFINANEAFEDELKTFIYEIYNHNYARQIWYAYNFLADYVIPVANTVQWKTNKSGYFDYELSAQDRYIFCLHEVVRRFYPKHANSGVTPKGKLLHAFFKERIGKESTQGYVSFEKTLIRKYVPKFKSDAHFDQNLSQMHILTKS